MAHQRADESRGARGARGRRRAARARNDRLRGDEAGLLALGAELDDLRRKLPPEARQGVDGLELDGPAALRVLLDEAAELLVPRLYGTEDDG